MAARDPESFRISDEAKVMVKRLEDWTGLKRSGVVEQAIREKYFRDGGIAANQTAQRLTATDEKISKKLRKSS